MVEVVEQARPRRCREPENAQGPQMSIAEHGLEATRERGIDEYGVEMHRRLGHRDRVPAGQDRAVQIGQGLGVAPSKSRPSHSMICWMREAFDSRSAERKVA